jgi:hypothetical protein
VALALDFVAASWPFVELLARLGFLAGFDLS